MPQSPDHDVINIRDWVRTTAGLRKRTPRDPPTPLWLQALLATYLLGYWIRAVCIERARLALYGSFKLVGSHSAQQRSQVCFGHCCCLGTCADFDLGSIDRARQHSKP